jgi:glycosyltransferase involved in cell wall biosynthesis
MHDADVPLFSVVVPTRNRPELLQQAIESVAAQSLTDWELIVVDDASDPTAEIPRNGRIRMVRLATRGGPGSARNAGVAAASGRYIAFLDDDDLFTADRLEIASRGLERAPIAVCGSRFIDHAVQGHRNLNGRVGDVILNGPTPSLGATAVDRASCLAFDERWHGVEDVDWWLRITATTSVTTLSSVGYLVRRRMSADPERLRQRVEENHLLLEVHRLYFESHRRALAFRLKRIGLMSLALGERAAARRVFARSLRTRPTAATGWHLVRSSWPRRRRP